ncbi:MAG: hypothetical protein ACTIDV_02660 [Moraxellaceae bacterium]
MKKTVLNMVLSTAFIVALGVGVSACSGGEEHEEVLAIDMVDEAAELARANAPEAEDMEFPETAPMPAADATATDGTEADATATAEAGTADTSMADATTLATESADTAAAPAATDSADMATPADAAATPAE